MKQDDAVFFALWRTFARAPRTVLLLLAAPGHELVRIATEDWRLEVQAEARERAVRRAAGSVT